MKKIVKRKILFLSGNCSGRCLLDEGDGVKLNRIYSLNSITEEWACAKTDYEDVERKRFYEYFV